MAYEEPSDPKIVQRLKNIPPFDPEETPPEAPVEQEAPETPPEPVVEAQVEEKTEVAEEPKEEKDRTTEQFEKLKEHNAQLKAELEKTKAQVPTKNALDSLYPEPPKYPEPPTTNVVPTQQQFPNLTQKEIKDVFASMVDSQGYVDSGLMIETFRQLDQKAKESEERAKRAEEENKKVVRRVDDFERNQIMREVHARFPRLNPDNANSTDPATKFDQRLYDQFRKETMYQWSTIGTADPMKVAEMASEVIYGSDMKKADKEKAEQAELAKKNINATNVAPSSQRESYGDHDELVMATRLGKKGAIAERLARAGQ